MPNQRKRARRRKGGFGVLLPTLTGLCAAVAIALVVMLVRSDPLAPDPVEETLPYRYNNPIDFADDVTSRPLVVGPTIEPEETPAPTEDASEAIDLQALWGGPVSGSEPEQEIPVDIKVEEVRDEEPEETKNPDETKDPDATEDPDSYAERLAPTPMPGDYFLPIYDKALRTPNDRAMIAITIDDCDKLETLTKITEIADKYNAKLTLFPTGAALMKNPKVFRTLYNKFGYELENYTYDANKLDYTLTSGELALQLWRQSIATSYVLKGDYQQHFYRPQVKQSAVDQRTHFFIRKLKLNGVASYTYSYLYHDVDYLTKSLANGNIYQFDMSKESMAVFEDFLSEANRKGYKMVTMNDLFGLDDNKLSKKLTISKQELPSIDDYEPSYYDLKLYDRAFALYDIQDRLLELGYLVQVLGDHMADGIYGADTSIAVSEFQANIGHAATGDADVETQERLFADDAPVKDPAADASPEATIVP